jgi:23S rRNA (guanosine2251-2'-O)-methyltransferase
MKLNAKQLRDVKEEDIIDNLKSIKRRPIYFILENIYDTYNIGGLFRLADALAIRKIYICGESETPPNSRIKKASIGTYKVVPWEYKKTAGEAIRELKSKIKNQSASWRTKIQIKDQKEKYNTTMKQWNNETIKIIAVEQHTSSIPYTKADYSLPLALVFGNETFGVTGETLKLVDQIVEIPMWGINKSLNVIVSAAIISYWIVSLI